MQKNVIITRSAEENKVLAQNIMELGANPIESSMLRHVIIPEVFKNLQKLESYQYLIITSKFAARLVSKHYHKNISAYIVGEESAKIIGLNPYININGVYNTISDLKNSFIPDGKNTLYLSGNHISEEIPFAHRIVIYNTNYAENLSSEALNLLEKNSAEVIMFYSKNSAENFITLIKSKGGIILQNLKNSVVIALSKEIGSVLEKYVKHVLFPEIPNADAMLLKLKEFI